MPEKLRMHRDWASYSEDMELGNLSPQQGSAFLKSGYKAQVRILLKAQKEILFKNVMALTDRG